MTEKTRKIYEAIIANWENPNFDWLSIKESLSKHYDNWKEVLVKKINNYIVKDSFIKTMPNYLWAETSEKPTFLLESYNGKMYTAEVKSYTTVSEALKETTDSWKKAELRFIYDKTSSLLYHLRRDKSLIYKSEFKLIRNFVSLNKLAANI